MKTSYDISFFCRVGGGHPATFKLILNVFDYQYSYIFRNLLYSKRCQSF
ncbi:hypothetical protein XNA1_2110004 [Xenorhabdus nematophila str. Anatoliense]|nr:hypothetical protein XNA1_2110004 [Xenorhabdus nematophila str. Anatoliense]